MTNQAVGQIKIEKIAQPMSRLPVINQFSQYIPARSLLACADFAALHSDSALFLINVRTLKEEKYPLPEKAHCGFRSLKVADDSTLYLASGNGSLYRFDLEGRTFSKAAVLFEKEGFLADTYVSKSGKVYVGNYPEAYITEYDPATGAVRRFETLPRNGLGLYSTGFMDLPNGQMLVLVTGGNPGILMFDPATGSREVLHRGEAEKEWHGFFDSALDDERVIVNYAHHACVFNWKRRKFEEDLIADFPEEIFKMTEVAGARYFTGNRSLSMYKLKDGKVSVAKAGFPNMNMVYNYHDLGDGEFAAMGDNGLFMRFNPATGSMVTHQIDNVSDRGMGIQFLHKVPGEDVVVGAHFIDSQMFKVALGEKKSESSLNKVVPYPGQVNCGTTVNGRFYLGSYIAAVISEYDWRKPFVPGENPVVVGEVGQDQNRPTDMVTDGKYVYIATLAEYGHLGGAISVFDPATRAMEVYRNFVKDHSPTSLRMWPKRKLLVGATTIFGDCGTKKPTATSAVAFLWDTEKRETAETWSPWQCDTLRIVDVSPDGLCLGMRGICRCEGNECFLWNLADGTKETRKWPVPGLFIGGLFMNEREFYGASEHGLFVLDIRTNEYRMLTHTTQQTGSYLARTFEKLNEREFLHDIQGVTIMKAAI